MKLLSCSLKGCADKSTAEHDDIHTIKQILRLASIFGTTSLLWYKMLHEMEQYAYFSLFVGNTDPTLNIRSVEGKSDIRIHKYNAISRSILDKLFA